MKGVSFFAGVAGFDIGFAQAGIEVVLQVEWDEACQGVLRRFGLPMFGDIKKLIELLKLNNEEAQKYRSLLAAGNVFFGGFPCQDVSLAGRRAGLAGERSGEWFGFRELIEMFRPSFIVLENVPGLLSSNDGDDMRTVTSGLEELGYRWAYRTFDSQYFGVAQRRERVFIVASLGNFRCVEVLFEPEMLCWDTPPSRETGKDIAGTLGSCPPGSGSRGDYERMTFIPSVEVSPALCRRDRKGVDSDCAQPLVVSAPITTTPYADTIGREDKLVVTPFDETQITSKDNRSNPQPGDPSHPLATNARPPAVVIGFDKSRAEFTGNDLAGSLRCNGGKSEGVNDGKADNQCIAFHATQDPISSEEVSPALSAGSTKGMGSVAVAFTPGNVSRGAGSEPSTDTFGTLQSHHAGDQHPCVAFRPAGQDGFVPSEVSPPLAATDGGGAGVPAAFFLHSANSEAMLKEGPGPAGGPAEVARALDRNGGSPVGQGGNVVVQGKRRVRRLTPMECERIQGFPDNWTLYKEMPDGTKRKQKDSPRYKQLGNAVTTHVAAWIGLRLKKAFER